MPKTIDTVHGYVRNEEKVLSISIPPGLLALFILFYGAQVDEWDPDIIAGCLKLADDNRTVTHNTAKRQQCNAYGKRVCESGKHEWKFKINHIDSYCWIIIGVWRIQENVQPPMDVYFTKGDDEKGYAFWTQGKKTKILNGAAGPTYGRKCKTGDVIDMTLDLDNWTLGFKINGVSFGDAFVDIKQAKYRAAVCLYKEQHNSITIVE